MLCRAFIIFYEQTVKKIQILNEYDLTRSLNWPSESPRGPKALIRCRVMHTFSNMKIYLSYFPFFLSFIWNPPHRVLVAILNTKILEWWIPWFLGHYGLLDPWESLQMLSFIQLHGPLLWFFQKNQILPKK